MTGEPPIHRDRAPADPAPGAEQSPSAGRAGSATETATAKNAAAASDKTENAKAANATAASDKADSDKTDSVKTESAKAARKRRRREPPPDPTPLPGLIDAHTHLAASGGRDPESVRAILDHAETVGVGRVVTVADDMVDARWAMRAAEWDDRAFAAVALHPTHAGDLDDAAKAELEEMVRDPRVVAVGETGLDYYWPGRSESAASPAVQAEAFAWHIDLAKRVGKPLMIHNREADRDLLDILAAEGAPDTVIMHCFSSNQNVARECVDRGYLLSFAGTVTFANAGELRAAAQIVPDELLLVETDAPFLTPDPYRGQPNQPYCLPYTARVLADVRGVSDRDMAHTLGSNALRVYRMPLQ